ncbi:hypothetical protein [Streptomyces sp. NPDC058572]|uniref:hypothetical protein n=1 Tax=Streptomyces sp. NPDC058572 TaxID=3346546 RepID=UPI00365F1370
MTDQPKEFKAVWERTRDLGQKLDKVNERLETLEGQNLADAVAELSLVVKKLAEKPESAKPIVWNWGAFSPEQQAAAWEMLLDWMQTTFLERWPRSYKEMLGYAQSPNSCWYKHPDMVETLTGLFAAYHWAFTDAESGPLRVAEWLDRWLPGAVRQGKFILADCKGIDLKEGHADPFRNKKQVEDYEDARAHVHLLTTGELPT